jgi:hypothetical protein
MSLRDPDMYRRGREAARCGTAEFERGTDEVNQSEIGAIARQAYPKRVSGEIASRVEENSRTSREKSIRQT